MSDDAKPPYEVPTVERIKAEHEGATGLIAVSTFAGAGGSSTGYRWAGYDVRWASEYQDDAADSYEANWPRCTVDRRDIRTVSGREILDAVGLDREQLDLFDGSPPCQPFSLAGRRDHNWGRDVAHGDGTVNAGGSEDLLGEWVRLVAEMRPRAAVMENVKGLTIGKAKGYLLSAIDDVRALGYRAGVRLLDAQWLGVPQRRVRVFVVAVRSDVGDPVMPAPLPWRYTMADACPWLSNAQLELAPHGYFPGGTYGSDDEPVPTVTTLGFGSYVYRIKVVDRQLGSGFVPGDVDPDHDPSSTIVASGADQFEVHGPPPPDADPTPGPPWVPRKFTIAEARRLCGFPDDYVLTGGYRDQWARLGNSVPPPVTYRVGSALAEVLAR